MKFLGSREAIAAVCVWAVAGVVGGVTSPAEAAPMVSTPTSDPLPGLGDEVANARFRVHNQGNWDMFLGDSGNPTGQPSTQFADLGTTDDLSGVPFSLTLSYDANTEVLTFDVDSGGSGPGDTLTLDTSDGYDKIVIRPRVLPKEDNTYTIDLDNVDFSIIGGGSVSFADNELDVAAVGPGSDVDYGLIDGGQDLSLISWTLSADLVANVVTGTADPSERLRLDIFLVPEPVAATLLGLPLLLARRARRRC
ncbi:MAG: hypothetical protein AAF710_02485 [Planctomycetota bacterium]